MILVDTSVWIDFFTLRDNPQTGALKALADRGDDICICGPIAMEILQGIRSDRQVKLILSHLRILTWLPMDPDVYLAAAEIHRKARRRGITIRQTVDCMIAACAIHHNALLLHKDRDFNLIARITPLKLPNGNHTLFD